MSISRKKILSCSIVILTYNDYDTTVNLLNTIKEFDLFKYIVIVDNCSMDGSYEKLQNYVNEKIILLRAPGNDGYSRGNNIGIKYLINNSDEDIICIANSDVEFEEVLVKNILTVFEHHSEYCILAGLQVDPDGNVAPHPFWTEYSTAGWFRKILEGYRILGRLLRINDTKKYINEKLSSSGPLIEVGAVEGSMFFIRKEELKSIGLLDEGVWIYCEEDILAKKMKRIGRKTGVLISDKYIHYGAKTTSKVFASFTKINHMFNSSIYYFNKYQSKNKFMQFVNYSLCLIKKVEDIIVKIIKD